MKNLEKLLQSSKKLEERQTARKAKEIDEVYLFNLQKECYKKCELDRILEINQTHTKRLDQEIEEPVTAEHKCIKSKAKKLLEAEEFEKHRLNPPINDFEVIAEMQGFSVGEKPHVLKQLPAGSSDAFTHELTELTEVQFQRELKQNERAIKNNQENMEEEEKKTGNVFFFHPVKRRAK